MKKLVSAVKSQHLQTTENPKLEVILDNYLQMIWDLSLSAPVDYIEQHPFDLTDTEGIRFYEFTDPLVGQASPMTLGRNVSLRKKLALECPQRGGAPFSAYVDGVELLRPLSFTELPKSRNAIKDAMFFVGKADIDFGGRPLAVTGGEHLSFEAYLLWNSLIIPTEHRGILIRIGDASGTLYDETFMKYQVSEQTRLRQLSGEIFIKSGLDPALNIDRESFNTSHPHYRIVMNWLHGAIRQFTNSNKALGNEIRNQNQELESEQRSGDIEKITCEEIQAVAGKEYDIPEVIFESLGTEASLHDKRKSGSLVFVKEEVFPIKRTTRTTHKKRGQERLLEKQIAAVAKILHAHGLFDEVSYKKQQQILHSIVKIFSQKR